VVEARRRRETEARQAAMKSDLMMMAEGVGKALPALAKLGGGAAE
jgi:hypothetical protein